MEPSQTCQSCKEPITARDGVQFGSIESGYRLLCGRCFNQEIARTHHLNFEHVHFQPVDMVDGQGHVHRFHFRVHLLVDRVALEAFEVLEDDREGYEFQVIDDDPEADLFALMGRLVERIRRSLAQTHLKVDEQFGRRLIADMLVRGRISWDREEEGRVPLLVIDGQPVSWQEFGEMLMAFEGWQLKREIRDRFEEL